jgi:hypothetical protein
MFVSFFEKCAPGWANAATQKASRDIPNMFDAARFEVSRKSLFFMRWFRRMKPGLVTGNFPYGVQERRDRGAWLPLRQEPICK